MDQLFCGRAIVDITPTKENGILPMPSGFSANIRELTEVFDDLKLRVIALKKNEETVLLISLDIVNMDSNYYGPIVSKKTGIKEESLFFLETTAHSTIRAGGDHRNRNNDPEALEKAHRYRDLVLAKMLSACDEALQNMQSVTVKIGRSESYVNVNRDYPYLDEADGQLQEFWKTGFNPKGDSDRELIVLSFIDRNDHPLAFIVNYGMFNVFMDDNMAGENQSGAISSDLGGYVSKRLESRYPDAVAMYTLGANCNNDPLLKARNAIYDPDLGGRRLFYLSKEACRDILVLLGDIHYGDAVRAFHNSKTVNTEGKLSYTQGEIALPGRSRERIESDKENSRFYKVAYHSGEKKSIRFKVMKLGDLVFVFQGGSIYSSIGKAMKAESIYENTILVCGYSNPQYQFEGALVDDDALRRGGHDAERSRYRPGFTKSAAVLLMNELIAKLEGDDFYMEILGWESEWNL